MYTVETKLEDRVVSTLSASCAKFLRNISRYDRSSYDGSYRWAWDGKRILARVSVAQFLALQHMGASDETLPLTVNGKLIGQFSIWKPYAYPQLFLILELEEQFWYDSRVVRRFAQFAGWQNKAFDMKLLEVRREDDVVGVPGEVIL